MDNVEEEHETVHGFIFHCYVCCCVFFVVVFFLIGSFLEPLKHPK